MLEDNPTENSMGSDSMPPYRQQAKKFLDGLVDEGPFLPKGRAALVEEDVHKGLGITVDVEGVINEVEEEINKTLCKHQLLEDGADFLFICVCNKCGCKK